MGNIFENLTHKIPKLYEHYLSLGKKYSQMAIRRGKKVGEKSKIQIELGRLKWELKQKYQKLGNYIIQRKEVENIMKEIDDTPFLENIICNDDMREYIKIDFLKRELKK